MILHKAHAAMLDVDSLLKAPRADPLMNALQHRHVMVHRLDALLLFTKTTVLPATLILRYVKMG